MFKSVLFTFTITSLLLFADVISIPDKYLTEKLNNKVVKNLLLEGGWSLVSLYDYSQKNYDIVTPIGNYDLPF